MLLPDEWRWLEAVTAVRSEFYGISGRERLLLYAVAIQTGLRANELRSLTRGSLFLNGPKPYLAVKALATKNAKDARQYVEPDVAGDLRAHIATKAPKTHVFELPAKWRMAAMIRADLDAARGEWLKAVLDDPAEYEKRAESDFLVEKNHERRAPGLSQPAPHVRRLAGDEWGTPEVRAGGDEAQHHRAHDGHLRPPVPRTRGGDRIPILGVHGGCAGGLAGNRNRRSGTLARIESTPYC